MLTLLKKIFTWWNRDTFGTRLKTIIFGKFVGKDEFGNKYYEGKNGKRWVIYFDEIDASKIPVEWYSWMHFTPNKIEKNHDFKKYDWQNLINQILLAQVTLTILIKIKMLKRKNIKLGKLKDFFFLFILIFLLIPLRLFAEDNLLGSYTDIKVLDKISSKNILIKLKNGENKRHKDLIIKSVKCKNSKFDDNPEITAYLQVSIKTV